MNIPLNIDWQQLLLHLLNFIILALGLYLLLYGPIKNFINKRREHFEALEKKAAEAERSAEELQSQYLLRLKEAEEEVLRSRAAESERLALEAEKRLGKAEEEAVKIISDARAEAAREKTRIMESAQKEMADMVVLATSALLAKDRTPETSRAIYEQFLSITGGESDNKK